MWTLSCLLISTNTNLNNVISYKLKNKVFPIQIYTLFYSCALFSIIFRCLFVWCRIKCDRRYFLFDQVCPLNFVKQKKQRLCLLLGIVKSVEEMLELHNITEKFVNRHRIMQRKQQDKEKCLHSKGVCRQNVMTPKDWFINITSVLKKFETLFYVRNIHGDINKIIENNLRGLSRVYLFNCFGKYLTCMAEQEVFGKFGRGWSWNLSSALVYRLGLVDMLNISLIQSKIFPTDAVRMKTELLFH